MRLPPRSSWPRRSLLVTSLLAALVGLSPPASAELPPKRTVHQLPSANGHGAILLDLSTARLHHFREHLFATEEPLLDGAGNEVWSGNQPQSVATRDLLYDAYFGLRSGGAQGWLTARPVDLDRSGYAPWAAGKTGGTGVAMMVQSAEALEVTQYFFAPHALGHDGFVMLARVRNTGASDATGVSVFSLHNFHLGFGRPGVMADIGEQGETIAFDPATGDLLERAFAGVVVARPLAAPSHRAAWSGSAGQSGYDVVNGGGAADLADLDGEAPTADGSVSAYQFDVGTVPAGGEAWAGVAFAHHGDPFQGAAAQAWLDAYVAGKGPQQIFDAEIAEWAAFQGKLAVPAGASTDEEALFRQSAAMLRMAQSQEDRAFLRESLTQDGEPRYTRFGAALGGPKATLPGEVLHRGKGAVLASLPPGEWTVAWIRDGAYAAASMSRAGMAAEARDALEFYLGAEGGRFQSWNELKPYSMPAYQISLVRYTGFGVEETDFNDFGPNLEFDGFGLFLWSLRQYEALTKDTTLADEHWPLISTKIGDALVALIDPATGLVRKDSSIWETHWNGRERAYAYTSITAARGLCDAAALAERVGDAARAKAYRDAGLSIRAAIATRLTDQARGLAANAEELASGSGYWDAAVLDAIAMGLFDPHGVLAKATLAGLDANLIAPAGAGWSRNDDRTDHAGGSDLSPWGGEYDSAEWVVTDLRGSIATRLGGDTERSERLLSWVLEQSKLNYNEVAETYDETSGNYKFNSPMMGFGAGAFILALAARNDAPDPACGAYFDESSLPPPVSGQGGASGTGGSGGSSGAAGSAGTAGAGATGGAGGSGATGGAGGSGGSGAGGDSGAAGGLGAAAGPGGEGGASLAGSGGSGASGGSGGSGGSGAAAASGKGGAPSAGGQGGSGGSGGAGADGAGAAPEAPGDDGGCGCRIAREAGAPLAPAALTGLLALSLARRRRRR
jgi:GH15 family glucan-1,4-alpha-glucosidase